MPAESPLPPIDLPLLERWLTGWSLSRGLPPPVAEQGGLRVEVGQPLQLRRHVFAEAGPALQACAARIDTPFTFLKAPVAPAVLRAALPLRWTVEEPGYLMLGPALAVAAGALPAGYRVDHAIEHGARVVTVLHGADEVAASGRLVLHGGSAIFDQIVTADAHRRRGLATWVMHTLDALAAAAGAHERLLVATALGRNLYGTLGWRDLAPWSTAVLAEL